MRETIKAAVIEGDRILLVRKRGGETWSLPGGKPKREWDESDLECLRREIREELGVELRDPSYFGSVQGIRPRVGKPIKVRIYLARLIDDPQPCAEIAEIAWALPGDDYDISEPNRLALQALSDKGYL